LRVELRRLATHIEAIAAKRDIQRRSLAEAALDSEVALASRLK
jgi:hypothetical protein